MTEQPAQPRPQDDGSDKASHEHRVTRAHKSNDLANALVTLRDDLPTAALEVQNFINTTAFTDQGIDPEETIRALANVILTLTMRISNYAHELDARAGDPDYFTKKHARVVLAQLANPVIRSINTTEPK